MVEYVYGPKVTIISGNNKCLSGKINIGRRRNFGTRLRTRIRIRRVPYREVCGAKSPGSFAGSSYTWR